MRVIKQGEVIFRAGEIAEIKNFVFEGTLAQLQRYVKKHYVFKGKKVRKC